MNWINVKSSNTDATTTHLGAPPDQSPVLKPLRRLIMILAVLWLMMMSIAVVMWLTRPQTLPFKTVNMDVSGDSSRVTQTTLKETVMAHLHGGFFTLNRGALQNALQTLPWVQTATVKRKWPGTLNIAVTIQTPVARWQHGYLVNAQGHVFCCAATVSADASLHSIVNRVTSVIGLPAIDANDVNHPAERDEQALPQLDVPKMALPAAVNQLAELSPMINALGLTIQGLRLDGLSGWFLTLSNGMVLALGQPPLMSRVQQFVRLYPQLFAKQLHSHRVVKRVDLRYENGFSIDWATSNVS